ncbi:MAG: GGDEF domain-containing protein [Pelovirga sp.]
MTAVDPSAASPAQPPPTTCPVGVLWCPFPNALTDLQQEIDHLIQQVRTDALTGVANYRSFIETLELEIERSSRNGRPTSLLMVDLDHFKKVNDIYGHEVGNQALVHVARVISGQIRKLDVVCRYGGEEFAVVLPETELHAAIPVAERIRLALAESPLQQEGLQLKLTASLGLATYRPYSLSSAAELISQADHYLYQAKQGGRNRLCHTDVSPPESISNEEKQSLLKLFGRDANAKD